MGWRHGLLMGGWCPVLPTEMYFCASTGGWSRGAGNRTVYSRPALHRATLAIMSSQDPPVCLAQCLAWNKASRPLRVSIGSPTGLVPDSWVAVLSLALQFGPSNNPCKMLGTAHGSSCKGNYKPEKDACQAADLTDLQSPRDCSMNPPPLRGGLGSLPKKGVYLSTSRLPPRGGTALSHLLTWEPSGELQ